MKKSLFLLTVLILFCVINLVFSQNISDLIKAGDDAYANFNNSSALESYASAIKQDPDNYEATWKLSRAYVDEGEIIKDKTMRKEVYKKGEFYARRAIEIDSTGAKGHLYLSIALGRVALDEGKKEQVRLSKEIKIEIDKSLELDSGDDIAWHVLGRWHRKMATLGWIQRKFANLFLGGVPKEASVEKAAECFQRAININPNHINHYLELGLTYEKLKRKEDAIVSYEKVVELPKADSDDELHKEEAAKRLKKLKK